MVREWIPHIGPLTKVIPLKLFLDIVPSSSAEITCALCGRFREGSVYMPVCRFVSKQRKSSNAVGMSSLIFWLQARELRLSVCFNTHRNLNRSLNKRWMSPAQTITTEWTTEKCLDKRQTNPQTQARQPNKQAPVVQRLDNAIHRINHYPANSVVCFVHTYPLDSDLSGG